MRFVRPLTATLSLLLPCVASAVSLPMCVYDPGGAAGDAFQAAKKYQTAALQWGVTLELRPYTSESVAAADFRNGKCDAALLTGVRSQQFSKAAYSIESIGVLPSYESLEATIATLAKDAAAQLMTSGDYEVAGVFPAGAVYLYVNDRSVIDIRALAGKKICTLDFDPSAKFMVEHIGAQVVPADVGTFASLFNNGSCDVAYAPATAYGPLELYKGLGETGGIVRFPLSQLTLQVLVRTGAFPQGYGQTSRTWSAEQFDSVLELTTNAEADVDAKFWVSVPQGDAPKYTAMFKDVRTKLVANGVYDPTVVKLLEAIAAKYP